MPGPGVAWRALKRAWMLQHLGDPRFRHMWDTPPPDEWVALDCEATGLNPRQDDIIAIGAVRIVGQRVLTSERLELLVQPSRAMAADAIRVHGLRQQDLAHGLPPDEAMHRLLHFIGPRPLVGYFLEFDLALINRAVFPLLGVPLPQARHEVSAMFHEWKFRQLPAWQQQGHASVDLRFATLLRELDIPEWPAHNALNDAVMAALAFIKLRRLLTR